MALPVKPLQNVQNTTVTDFQPELEVPAIKYPNLTDTHITMSFKTNYTAPSDGYVYIRGNGGNYGATLLKINTVEVWGFYCRYELDARLMYPVKKGDVCYAEGSESPKTVWFISSLSEV